MKYCTRILITLSISIVAFTANSQDIFKTANVGIGNIKPLSKFEVNGSFGEATTTVNATTTLDATYAIVLATPATAYNIILPLASSATLRIYTIVYNGTAGGNTITLQASGSDNIISDANSSTSYALSGGAITVQSDGTNWHITVASPPVDGTAGGVFYGTGIGSAFSAAGTSGQVLVSRGAGEPTWGSVNSALTTHNIITATTGVTVTNGTSQVVGGSNVSVDIATNSATSPGLVPIPTGDNLVYASNGTGAPAWGALSLNNSNSVTGALPVGNGGTGATTLTSNGIVYGNGTSTVGITVAGTNGQVLTNSSGTPVWTTASYPATTTINQLLFSSSANTITGLAVGTSGQVLSTNASGVPTWITPSNGNITGTGTTNYVTKWTTGGSVLGNSLIYDNGSNVGVGTTTPGYQVQGAGEECLTVSGSTGGALELVRNLTTACCGGYGNGEIDWVNSANTTSLPDGNQGVAFIQALSPSGTNTGNWGADLQFATKLSGSTGLATERMRILNTGALAFGGAGNTGSTGQILQSNGANAVPVWTTTTYPLTTTINQLLYSSSTNTVTGLATGTSGQILSTNAGDVPNWGAVSLSNSNSVTGILPVGNGGTGTTTLTPNGIVYGNGTSAVGITAVGANGQMLTNSSGTPVWTTATYPATTTINQILYSSANNTITGIAAGTSGQVLTANASGVPTWANAASGSVTSFSAGTLSPLFTTSVANATSTPALSFTLSNAAAETILGNNTAIGATPTYFSPTLASALFANQGTTITVLHGNAGGNPSWSAVSLVNDVTGTLPASNGGTGLSTVGTNGQVLTVVSGAPTWVTPAASGVSSVTSTSPVGIGGTSSVPNVYLSGTNGGVLYGTGSGAAFSGVGVAGQILESTGAGEPIWVNVSTLDTIVGDNWGSEYAYTDSITSGGTENTITGTGLGTNPLRLSNQGATNGQVLIWNSSANTWKPGTPSSAGWQVTGNSGTTAGTNFVGTTDPTDLVFKTNSNENLRILNSNGYVGIGTSTPQTNLVVNGAEAVGSYDTIAPSNGLIVSGQVGIGTKTPNTSAALDITSSTQGILIPRLTANPASPAQALMYFNSTTGCFMFYNGTGWQAIVCGCPNIPPSPGTITGSSTFCPNATGVTYSISPVSVATGYTWTVPTGVTITAGQGSTSITVTEGAVAGNVTVSASNNCGTGTASTLAITPVTTNITAQPANVSLTCIGGNATFTVTATGGGLTYQWQVSTNGGTSWSNVTNVSPYSGATTATLTITNPPSTMNGYEYECIVTGTCSFTSNAATLSVSSMESVPITLTNNQSTATSANFQQMLTINFSSFSTASPAPTANLNNVEFTTGPAGTGTPLYAWFENSAVATVPATAPSSSSTAAVVWVNFGSTTIPANSNIKIYMNFMSSAVMTSTTSFTGEASNISPTYGQYDNGAKVFPNVYTAWGGLSGGNVPAGISKTGSVTITNNATNTQVTVTASSGTNGVYYTTTPSSASPATVLESYQQLDGAYLWWGTGGGSSDGSGAGVIIAYDNGTNSSDYVFKDNSGNTGYTTTAAVATGDQHPYVWSILLASATSMTNLDQNYSSIYSAVPFTTNSTSSPTYYGTFGTTQNGTGNGSNNSCTYYWSRTRLFPPSGVMPTVSVGAYGCY